MSEDLLNLHFLEQIGIQDPKKRELVLDALNKKGEIYTGGGVSKLISWGIHETYANDLQNFWKEQPIDAEFFEFLNQIGKEYCKPYGIKT